MIFFVCIKNLTAVVKVMPSSARAEWLTTPTELIQAGGVVDQTRQQAGYKGVAS